MKCMRKHTPAAKTEHISIQGSIEYCKDADMIEDIKFNNDITGGSFTNRVKEPPVSFYKITVKE